MHLKQSQPGTWRIALVAVMLLLLKAGNVGAQDLPTVPPLQPSLFDFLTGLPIANAKQQALMNPLLRQAFQDAPPESLKGTAAKIKAEQLDAKNRIEAVRFLATVDCVQYPEAPEVLLKALQEDPSENVRYEAAVAFQQMLARGRNSCSCNPLPSDGPQRNCKDLLLAAVHPLPLLQKLHQDELNRILEADLCTLPFTLPHMIIHKPYVLSLKDLFCTGKLFDVCKNGTLESRRKDYCLGCCGPDVLKALWAHATERDDDGCFVEPSFRVRQAAMAAFETCPCNPGNLVAGEEEEADEVAPPPKEEEPKESAPDEEKKAEESETAGVLPPLEALNGYCIVALKNRQFVKARPEFASTYRGRRYHFALPAAKEAFDSSPESYAPVGGGIDLVHWRSSGKAVYGRYLREYAGQFYLFATKQNWATFTANPVAYNPTLKPVEKQVLPAHHVEKETTESSVEQMDSASATSASEESLQPTEDVDVAADYSEEPVQSSEDAAADAVQSESTPELSIKLVKFDEGDCIVSFRNGRIVKGSDKFTATHEGRTYSFVNADAKALFKKYPTIYAPYKSGIDLQHLDETGEERHGAFALLNRGHMQMFVSPESAKKYISRLVDKSSITELKIVD